MARAHATDQLTLADLAYIEANFVRLAHACHARGQPAESIRALIHRGALPKPAYVLDDGTEMVPEDYFALADEAGGVEHLRAHFEDRYVRAAAETGVPVTQASVEQEWRAYLSGEYGVCLRRVTPENIVRKSRLMRDIERELAEPRPDAAGWKDRLATLVDELDELERAFAPFDRRRWGTVSRDRLITGVRARYGLPVSGRLATPR